MRKFASVGLVVSALLGAACSDDATQGSPAPSTNNPPGGGGSEPATSPVTSNDPMAAAPVPPPGKAMVRCIHAAADAPSVDVYVKGQATPVVTNITYGQTSGWLAVDPGPYAFEVRAAPSKSTDPVVYTSPSVTVSDQAMVSAIAAGLLEADGADAAFRILPLVENFAPVAPGKVRVRAVHAGADAPSVDLDANNDDPIAPEVPGIARFTDTGPAGVSLPAGQALALGIAAGGTRVTAFTTPKLPDGGQLVVIATGLLAKLPRDCAGFTLLAVGPSGSVGFIKQDPMLYALHAGTDAPRVDAFVGPNEIVSNVGFGEISGAVQVPPGAYTVDFFAAAPGAERPSGKPAGSSSSGVLDAGERYLTVATGLLSGSGATAFRLATYREALVADGAKSILRAVHSAPTAPAVDLGLAAGSTLSPVLFGDLAYGSASDDQGLAANPGHLVVGITQANQTSSILARFTVPALSAQRGFVLATGSLAPQAGQQSFRLMFVNTTTPAWTATSLFPH